MEVSPVATHSQPEFIDISEDGTLLVAASNNMLISVDLLRRRVANLQPNLSSVTGLALHADGSAVTILAHQEVGRLGVAEVVDEEAIDRGGRLGGLGGGLVGLFGGRAGGLGGGFFAGGLPGLPGALFGLLGGRLGGAFAGGLFGALLGGLLGALLGVFAPGSACS